MCDFIENIEDKSYVKWLLKECDIFNLSDYVKNLEKNVKFWYLVKILVVKIDLVMLIGVNLDL